MRTYFKDVSPKTIYLLMSLHFMTAFSVASIITRFPSVKSSLNISDGTLSTLVSARSWGALLSLFVLSWITSKIKIRNTMFASSLLLPLGLILLALLNFSQGAMFFAAGIFIIGFGIGLFNVHSNALSGVYEQHMKTSLLPRIHAAAPIGSLLGTLTAAAFVHFSDNPSVQYIITAAIATVVIVPITLLLPEKLMKSAEYEGGANDAEQHTDTVILNLEDNVIDGGEREQPSMSIVEDMKRLFASRPLIVLTVILSCAILWESAAVNWIPLFLIEQHGYSPGTASLILSTFLITVSTTRYVTTALRNRLSLVSIIALSVIVVIVGLIGFIQSQGNIVVVVSSVILWGAGAALTYPLVLSQASNIRASMTPSRNITTIFVFSTLAAVFGLQMIGYVSNLSSLKGSFICVIVLAAVFTIGLLWYNKYHPFESLDEKINERDIESVMPQVIFIEEV